MMGGSGIAGTDHWDVETDILVFGSGAGGLAASLFAVKRGMKVLLCEKSELLGGTTATSGGVLWVPGNRLAREAGIDDSVERAREYLRHELGNYYRADLVEGFLNSAGPAIDDLESGTAVAFDLTQSPDYHPDSPGGVDKGRSIIARSYDGSELGADFALVRPPMARLMVCGGMMVGPDEIPAFVRPFSSLASFRRVMRRLMRHARDRLRYRRGAQVSNGNALVARLLYSLRRYKADIWINAPLKELIRNGGRVEGAVVECQGRRVRVRARLGVVLATGGFPHDPSLRKELGATFSHNYSMAFTGNTGDGHRAARSVGAAVDVELASPCLWTPSSLLQEEDGREAPVIYGYLDRGRPGIIAVDPHGRRFVNESNSYHDIISALFRRRAADHLDENAKFYFICDANFVRKNGLGAMRPWPWTPSLRPFVRRGYITIGNSVQDLARKIGIDPTMLAETVERHNDFARTGVDLDFGKGSTSFNRVWGDPKAGPNPNLTPIVRAPFVALPILPATLGTAIGLKTNGDAQVVDESGEPIPGLFACGNELASSMRGFYPGGGITLGPAVVFAYRAILRAKHLASELTRLDQ
ncbi:FAD-dependent oxidoreductase [Microvirga puerhi]|uniref:FAD-dependent oxidoreductase n=1 Tax=Microvirga puerhi TaxID=2876078 RepID=A0ABS7VT46_9HYPH|nr:FAD-dependent oxidoreductase [Microvirga puerhi]MBZ6078731.1 FAD-dependent oxidoreductase [Microvirga puerhi]